MAFNCVANHPILFMTLSPSVPILSMLQWVILPFPPPLMRGVLSYKAKAGWEGRRVPPGYIGPQDGPQTNYVAIWTYKLTGITALQMGWLGNIKIIQICTKNSKYNSRHVLMWEQDFNLAESSTKSQFCITPPFNFMDCFVYEKIRKQHHFRSLTSSSRAHLTASHFPLLSSFLTVQSDLFICCWKQFLSNILVPIS